MISATLKIQITSKNKARDAIGVMCNIRKSAAHIGVCEHFEEVCNKGIGR
jgi:hypothetical protein